MFKLCEIVKYSLLVLFMFYCLCGLADSRRVKRIVNGNDVHCGTAPRVASLRKSDTSQHLCGAVLLSPTFALTAAHCVHLSKDEYILKLNNYCTEDGENIPIGKIVQIIKNQLYDRVSKAHDIAIMRITLDLNDVAWLNETVLPSSSFGVSGECTIYGYGYKDTKTMKTSGVLSSGEVTIISLDECTQKLGPFMAPGPESGMMCAAGYEVDACQGDSGSPVICEGLVEGISSYGMSCAVPDLPGVYTSVGAHLDFINNVMKEG